MCQCVYVIVSYVPTSQRNSQARPVLNISFSLFRLIRSFHFLYQQSFYSFFLTRVNSSRFNLKGLFHSAMSFLVHYLPFLAVLLPCPYILSPSTLKRLIQSIMALFDGLS